MISESMKRFEDTFCGVTVLNLVPEKVTLVPEKDVLVPQKDLLVP